MKVYLNKFYSILSNKFYFKLLYLLVAISFSTVLNDFYGIKLLNKVCLAWGLILIVTSLFDIIFRKVKIYYFQIFLYLFLILTLAFNLFRYPTSENIKIWLVNLIILVSIFSIDTYKSKSVLIKELNIFSYIYTSLTFILSFISLILIFSNKSIERVLTFSNDISKTVTFCGLFSNENSFGIAAGISFIICLYILLSTNSNKIKIFYYFNSILQLIALVISGGRSALLLVLSLVFIFIFIKFKNIWIRLLMLFSPMLIIPFLFKLSDTTLHYIFTGREYIWQAAWPIIKFFPLVGVGNSNKISTLIANPKHELRGVEAGGLHNIYIEIATVNGLIAAAFIILFIACAFFFLVKKIGNLDSKTEKYYFSVLLTLVFGIPVINLMESILVYIISFISIVFWVYTGYLIAILDKK
ncbi:O-antigen ligase family protein [Clostridium sp. DSM 100503]|uniref:O-antigen ligase family protein n=1 Tax=Clostridium sp. DSM 100503 TaxID=2963282 RepID=UPI00214A7588|nr:O-antigen ligase family protein [Clostridium sp. DSM 100503]MCR1950678.1 O-antigen ligase family protein [Clostridium sp. DSM 100503]